MTVMPSTVPVLVMGGQMGVIGCQNMQSLGDYSEKAGRPCKW